MTRIDCLFRGVDGTCSPGIIFEEDGRYFGGDGGELYLTEETTVTYGWGTLSGPCKVFRGEGLWRVLVPTVTNNERGTR